MPSSRHSPSTLSHLRRPAGPRCHGGASSLLRLGYGTPPARIATGRATYRLELMDDAAVEHVVGWPLRRERATPARSS